MTDLEMVKRCAKAMGLEGYISIGDADTALEKEDYAAGTYEVYDPLHDDAQAMELDGYLLKRGWIGIFPEGLTLTDTRGRDIVHFKGDMHDPANRRRARVECVAKLPSSPEPT